MPKQVFYKINEDRRHKLLKPALVEFVTKPYDKVTVLSLTTTMDILRTDFYYYFSDKEDIYGAILEDLKTLVSKGHENLTAGEAITVLFDKVLEIKGARNRQFTLDITENYHPQFAYEGAKRLLQMFPCNCDPEKAQVKTMIKIYRFMTVTNQYLKGSLSKEKAIEIMHHVPGDKGCCQK